MSPPDDPGKKVATFSRVLAWVVVACSVLAAAGWIVTIRKNGWPSSWGETVLALLSASLVFPLFLFVAWTGRSPRWMTSMENMVDGELTSRRIPRKSAGGVRRTVPMVASLVFGVFLIVFGNELGIFSGETRWFAIAVFAVSWAIVAGLLWRQARRRPPPGDP